MADGIAAGYGLDGKGIRVRVPAGQDFFAIHFIQISSRARSASYTTGTGGSFHRGKAAGA
jgi:hypothetical protein